METERIVRVKWDGSKSSGNKWAARAIDQIKDAGGTFDPSSKTWALPAGTVLDYRTEIEIETVA